MSNQPAKNDKFTYIKTPKGSFIQAFDTPLLSQGDVIEANASWRITDLDTEDENTIVLTLDQNRKEIDRYTGAAPTDKTEIRARVLDFNGNKINEVKYLGGQNGKDITLAQKVVAKKAILGSKKFLVLGTGKTGGGTGHGAHDIYPDGHHVKAIELNTNNAIKKNGLMIQFYQTGSFNCMIETVPVVGRMKPTFEKFEPA